VGLRIAADSIFVRTRPANIQYAARGRDPHNLGVEPGGDQRSVINRLNSHPWVTIQ
jgi:hypothetical protein